MVATSSEPTNTVAAGAPHPLSIDNSNDTLPLDWSDSRKRLVVVVISGMSFVVYATSFPFACISYLLFSELYHYLLSELQLLNVLELAGFLVTNHFSQKSNL